MQKASVLHCKSERSQRAKKNTSATVPCAIDLLLVLHNFKGTGARIAPVKSNFHTPPTSPLFTHTSLRLAGWLALLAIVLHTATPFAQKLTGVGAMDGVFCGALTPAAKLALAKLPDSGQTLLKAMQHECSLCEQASHTVTLTGYSDQGLLVPLILGNLVVTTLPAPPRSHLNRAAAPPPSHAPPVLI